MPASICGTYGNRGCAAREIRDDDSTALTQRQQTQKRVCCLFSLGSETTGYAGGGIP